MFLISSGPRGSVVCRRCGEPFPPERAAIYRPDAPRLPGPRGGSIWSYIAGLCSQRMDVGIAHGNRARLMEWAAFGTPALVLVVVGHGAEDPVASDPVVRALRELLTRASVQGDEAPVVRAVALTDELFAAVALALDEQADPPVASGGLHRLARRVALLERLIAEGRDEITVAALRKVTERYADAREEDQRRIVACLFACATRPALWTAAVEELCALHAKPPRGGFVRAAAAMRAATGRLPAMFESVCSLWSRSTPQSPETRGRCSTC
jgi:hypothetical protein